MRKIIFITLMCALMSVSALADFSAPAGLLPGDTFHWTFVTSATRNATSTNIADYDQFVNDAADASGQAVTGVTGVASLGDIAWMAIGSTATTHATNHIGTVDSAVYNLANQIVSATGKAGMFAGAGTSLTNPINIDENGVLGPLYTYTGTNSSGFGTPAAGGYYLGATALPQFSGVRTGWTSQTGALWVHFSASTPSNPASLYAISPELTVVPIPGAILLGILGLGVVGIKLRKFA